jgi:hypothetical protein
MGMGMGTASATGTATGTGTVGGGCSASPREGGAREAGRLGLGLLVSIGYARRRQRRKARPARPAEVARRFLLRKTPRSVG